MKKPVSVRRQKKENNQIVDANTPQVVEEILNLQNQLALIAQVPSNQQSLLDEISTLAIAQQKAGACFAETRQAQAELMELVISLQQDIREIKKNNLSVSEQNQSILAKLGHLSLLENIFAEVKQLKNSGRDDLKNILNILLNKKQDIDTERTISFQLGKTLIESKKSIESLMHLPTKLISIFDDSKERKEKKITAPEIIKTVKESVKPIAIEPKKVERKKIDFSGGSALVICSQSLFDILKRKLQVNFLLENNRSQVENTKAKFLVLETNYSNINNIWNYALYSGNSQHPKTKKLTEVIKLLRGKNIPNLLVDRTNESNHNDFSVIRNMSDSVLVCSNFVFNKLKDKVSNIEKIENFFNEKLYSPSHTYDITGDLMFLGEYLTDNNNLSKSFNKYLKELVKIDGCVYKGIGVVSELYDGVDSVAELNSLDESLVIKCIKENKIVLHLSDVNQDFISSQLLAYLACGKPVITNISKETEAIKDIVFQIKNESDLPNIYNKLIENKWLMKSRGHLGYRYVMNNHCSDNLLNKVLNNNVAVKELVTIVMATRRPHYVDRIITNLNRQKHKDKEIIIITQEWSEEDISYLDKQLKASGGFLKVKILSNDSDMTLGERLNKCAQHASVDSLYIAKMDDDDFYFENYLSDMLLPFNNSSYAMVGKGENFIYLEGSNKLLLTREDRASNREITFVAGPTLIIKKVIFESLGGFKHVNNGEDSDLIKRVLAKNLKIYSSDIFNFVQFRSKDSQNHTWKVKSEVFEKSCTFVSHGIDETIVSI